MTYPYISHSLKYANGYFYVSGDYFYKTDKNFNRVASYYSSIYGYKAIYYDSSSSLFYVAGDYRGVAIFDTNCNFQRFMTLGGYIPNGVLSYFNGNLYGDAADGASIVVASKSTGALVAKYTVCPFPNELDSINIDSFGYMAVGCFGFIALYNSYNGIYLNQKLEISDVSYLTAVDASGRFISMGFQ